MVHRAPSKKSLVRGSLCRRSLVLVVHIFLCGGRTRSSVGCRADRLPLADKRSSLRPHLPLPRDYCPNALPVLQMIYLMQDAVSPDTRHILGLNVKRYDDTRAFSSFSATGSPDEAPSYDYRTACFQGHAVVALCLWGDDKASS